MFRPWSPAWKRVASCSTFAPSSHPRKMPRSHAPCSRPPPDRFQRFAQAYDLLIVARAAGSGAAAPQHGPGLTPTSGQTVYSPQMLSYVDWIRSFCLSLPHATEDVQWEHNLLFRIAGKMFCIANLEPAVSMSRISFKCTPEKFAE